MPQSISQSTPQAAEVHTMLVLYAQKLNSPVVGVGEFIRFVEEYARRQAPKKPEWKSWTVDINDRIWAEIHSLIKEGKCKLIGERKDAKVSVVNFYLDMVNAAYEDSESLATNPFPCEETLGITIPSEHIRPLDINKDMENYLKNPQSTDIPLLKIVFPDSVDSALIPASFIPRRILLISLLKISAFLDTGDNLRYFFTRLSGQLKNSTALIRKTLGQIKTAPDECLDQIETPSDFLYQVWFSFCSQIRSELKKKGRFTALDISTFQAELIIGFFSDYYFKKDRRNKEKELVMQEIESRIDQPPYMYTLHDIMAFTNKSGRPFKDFYDQKDLVNFLEKKTFIGGEAGPDRMLPSLLIFHNESGDRIYINKSRVFLVVTKLLIKARSRVWQAIAEYWEERLRKFYREPSMKDDKEFEKLAADYAEKYAPQLMIFLRDKKMPLVQEEIDPTLGGTRGGGVYQANGTMRPLPFLLNLNRARLLSSVRIKLPFWYSIPFLFALGAFFEHRKRETKKEEQRKTPNARPVIPVRKTKQVVTEYRLKNLPPGQNLEQYLKIMEDQWHKVISPKEKERLVQDVRRQIKFKFEPIFEARKNMPVTLDSIDEMADGIIMISPVLTELGSGERIHRYVALYITKLLMQQTSSAGQGVA
jgi:hypothetical protein